MEFLVQVQYVYHCYLFLIFDQCQRGHLVSKRTPRFYLLIQSQTLSLRPAFNSGTGTSFVRIQHGNKNRLHKQTLELQF